MDILYEVLGSWLGIHYRIAARKKIRKGHVTVEGFLEYRWLFFNCIVAVVVGFSFQLMSDFFQC